MSAVVGTNLGKQNTINIPLPKFAGKDSEWDLFRLEWQDTYALHETAMGDQWTEQMKMFIFGSCMEDVAKKRFMALHTSQPHLLYSDMLRIFEKEFGRDAISQPRKDWENLSIRHISDMTLRDIRTFVSDFDICVARLGVMSEYEKSIKFLNALPPGGTMKSCENSTADSIGTIGWLLENHAP